MVKKQIQRSLQSRLCDQQPCRMVNAKFKSVKGLLLWQAFDKMRQMIMIKMALRRRIAETQYVGHLMLPSLIKALHLKARGLKMRCIRSDTLEGEVAYTDSKNRLWRYPVNLATRV